MLFHSHYRVYTPDHQHTAILSKFASIESVFKHSAPLLSSSDQSEVFKHEIGQQTYFIKRYYKTRGLLSWLGHSRFRNEIRNQHWFNLANIPSAKIISTAEQKLFFKTTKGFLVTEGLSNTRDLAEIAKQTPSFFRHAKRTNQLIINTAGILRQLHAHHFCHNDLHWRNLLVEDQSESSRVFLIDCPSGHFLPGPFFGYKRIKDLANLDKQAPEFLSRTQRLRFFLTYRDIKRLTPADKQLIMTTLRHKEHRKIRKQKSGFALLLHQIKFNLFHQ